jgi:D-sedoheptulose 7-phosphate isomerase
MFWDQYANRIREALDTISNPSVYALALTLQKARETGATVFTCGNGGSASAASHLAQDLSKGVDLYPPMRADCLCDSIPNLTAWANDEGYHTVFAQQVRIHGESGDVLIAISGSGNSQNVLNAVFTANTLGMRTWGITGFDGGELINLAHRCVHVKSDDMGMVEAVHGILFHWLVDALKECAETPNETRTWCPEPEAVR